MKITRSLGLLNILLLAGSVRAIEVVADSGCASSCIDSGSRGNVSDPRASSTQHDDLFCLDAHYSGGSEQTAKALYWQGCLSCEASSPSYAPGIHNDTENDVQMFLYNLRLNWAWCVLGFDGNSLAYNGNAFELCGTECQPIRTPITDGIFNWTATIRYDYCDSDNSAFANNFDTCRSCLANTGNFTIMANYLKALDIACDQKPEQGKALDLGFNIFQTGSQTSELNSTSSSSASATSSQSTAETNSSNNGGLSQGSKVGIGVGVGVGVGGALILLALGLFCLKRRKQRAQGGAVQDDIAGQTAAAAGYFSGDSPAEQKYHLVEAPNNLKGPAEAPGNFHGPVEAPASLNEAVELPSGPQPERHELDSARK